MKPPPEPSPPTMPPCFQWPFFSSYDSSSWPSRSSHIGLTSRVFLISVTKLGQGPFSSSSSSFVFGFPFPSDILFDSLCPQDSVALFLHFCCVNGHAPVK